MRTLALKTGTPSRPMFLCLMAVALIVPGCDESIQAPFVLPPPPQAGFVLFGTVRDSAGMPIPEAQADIIEGKSRGRSARTNYQGHFSLVGVSGKLTIIVWKEGFDFKQDVIDVNGDLPLQFQLARLESDGIIFGQTIRSYVRAGSPPCDPQHWDAQAPCRRFTFKPPHSGVFSVTIEWQGLPELDATLVMPNGTYLATSDQQGVDKVTLQASVDAGVTYELRVNSYYDSQVFNLKADLLPGPGRS